MQNSHSQSTPLDLSLKTINRQKDSPSLITPDATNPNVKCSAEIENQNERNIELSESEKDRPKEAGIKTCCSLSALHRSSSNLHDDSCRRHRTAFSRSQTSRLESEFQKDNYLSRSKRMDLANELELYENTIKVLLEM